MTIDVLRNVFEKNDNAARENREMLTRRAITCINLLGGAGSGKTALLEALIPTLAGELRVGVLEGDLATTRDAERIAALKVPVVQLLTEGGCHLNATLVQHGLQRLPLDDLELIIIENVGNPICPANFDLGEHLRMAVLSVAEGDDKPAKYPLLFRDARAVVITKCDLLPFTDFGVAGVIRAIHAVNGGAVVLRTSARDRTGIVLLRDWIFEHVRGRTALAAAAIEA